MSSGSVFSFSKVYVVINVILAEAVIAFTAGTIAELKLRMIMVGTAADGTFMLVETGLLFTADAL